MQGLRAVWRLVRVLGWAARGWWRVQRRFAHLDAAAQAREVEQWARRMLTLMGVEVQVEGAPAAGPVLLAANHISWLDILVMHAAGHCRFVAKSEIRDWPLVGALTTAGQSLYIERSSSRDALRVVHRMRDALLAGDVLGVFPEGSTGTGEVLLPFHGNLLQAAISADAPVQPVALRFIDPRSGAPSLAPCYVADDTLVGSIWRTLRAPALRACVRYGEPQRALGRERRAWAEDVRQTIAQLLK